MALDEYLASEIVLDCTDGIVTRREAFRRLMLLGVTAPGAAALLAACGNDHDSAQSAASAAPSSNAVATDPVAPTTIGSPAATTTAATAAPATQSSAAGAGSVAGQEIRFAGPQGDLIGVLAR